MTLIHYGGEIVATASPLRVHYTPPLDDRPNEDPLRRFVHAMAMYARDIAAGELRGPYRDQDAELFARTFLIADDDFAAHAGESDEQLAERFGVPLEQVAHKRRDPPAAPFPPPRAA